MLSKVREVFTQEYKRETEYREFMESKLSCFELNNKSEDVEEKVKRLVDKNFVSKFKMCVGEYK